MTNDKSAARKMERKYIFITGGVVSGLGKGTMAAALGRLLKSRGYHVTNQKIDPYINVDPGTMSPYRHGEVFVTEDGSECDLDVGHYERFVDENLTGECNITCGKIYQTVIEREREGGYNGNDVQVIPHITDEIKLRIRKNAEESGADIAIIEIGGTVGDIESLPLLEAIRQLSREERGSAMFIHLTLVPYLISSGEMKSKPTQHSVKELLSIGIQPDIIVCRTQFPLAKGIKDKIALFCNVSQECIIENVDVDHIYDLPLLLEEEGLANLVCGRLSLNPAEPDLDAWKDLCKRRREVTKPVKIALVGKYIELHDAYLSVVEAINHAALFNGLSAKLEWIDAEKLEDPASLSILDDAAGIIVPSGFGERGTLGMIQAVKYAREHKVPFLGIGMGMHCAAIDFARNIMGKADADTTEFNKSTSCPVIDIMPELRNQKQIGGTIRRGAFNCVFEEGTLIREAYEKQGKTSENERHRHRYEIGEGCQDGLVRAGLIVSAYTGNETEGRHIAAIELPGNVHPWFIGVQFNPEFKSRPNRPHPLFIEFVKRAGE